MKFILLFLLCIHASKQTSIHTHGHNEVTVLWGSLRLSPITTKYRALLVEHKAAKAALYHTFFSADLFSSSSWNNFCFSAYRSWIISLFSLICDFNCIWSCSISHVPSSYLLHWFRWQQRLCLVDRLWLLQEPGR